MQTLTKNNSNSSINRKLPDEALEDGIYCNSRASHVAVSLIGCPVQVQVKDGTIYDGILSTISPELTIVLDMAHKCNDSGTGASLPLTKETPIIDTIAFSWSDVVIMTALNVDLGYATRESFATDTAISGRANGQGSKLRELEKFEIDGPLIGGLEDGRLNGWSADDMFQTNESKFTIQSTFNQDLSQYTTPLPNQNSSDYREKSERAARLAMEIEGGDLSRDRVDLENGGEDEEMAFSAVHRNQRTSRNNHHSNTPSSSYRRGGGGSMGGMNGPPRTVGRGAPSGRGNAPNSGGPPPRQFSQQGPGATSPQAPLGQTSPAGGLPQQSSRPGGAGIGRQDSAPDNSRYHHQQPPQHGGRMQSDYGRQSSAPDNWRNHGPPPSAAEPRHAGNRNEVRPGPVALAGGPGRSPQPTVNDPRRSAGGLPSSAEKSRELSGVADSSKPPPWGLNQQSPSQQQQQPLPPRNELPLPPRNQGPAPPSAGTPRTPSSEQKPPQLKGPKETQRIADLQEFSEQFNLQLETSQAARDSKSSPRPSVQPGPSPHPSPLRSEQGGGVASGHDLQSHAHPGLKPSSSEPLIGKLPADAQLPHAPPAPVTMTKAADEARAAGDKVMNVGADGETAADAEKKKQIAKVSTLNPNAKEFIFNPGKTFQPKPEASPTPARVLPTMAPPTPTASVPQAAAPQAQILVPAGATYLPLPMMMPPGGQMVRPLQQQAATTKRATVSVASGRMDQAQAATGQPLVATPSAGFNIIPIQQVRLLEQQQQPMQMIVGPQMAQHMAGQQQHQQQQQRPMGPNQGGHPSSSPVHQQPMHAPQTPTSGTPQPLTPSQVYFSQQQQHGQMMGTPTSPQQAYPPQPHYTAALQQQLGHVAMPAGYPFGPAGVAQQYQQHAGGAPTATTPHGVVQMSGGGPGGYLQHAHMGQQTLIVQQPQQAPGQPHPAAQMQPMVGQGHPGIPGGVSSQPTALGPQAFVTTQPVGNVFYQVPYIQPGAAYHPAAGHMVSSNMPTFQSTQ